MAYGLAEAAGKDVYVTEGGPRPTFRFCVSRCKWTGTFTVTNTLELRDGVSIYGGYRYDANLNEARFAERRNILRSSCSLSTATVDTCGRLWLHCGFGAKRCGGARQSARHAHGARARQSAFAFTLDNDQSTHGCTSILNSVLRC